uniref:Uncharacterized protein n=1 Tax=Tetranychus urticae TaxID=32264 RepID=T1KT15_TETUR
MWNTYILCIVTNWPIYEHTTNSGIFVLFLAH